ncbi:nitroreductase family protein [Hwanghaeella sp.]|uniref:nitroreductase family protein n=1 Tax=Hwanghaeella sp. TaxID=2605943 RepID=UPI003CCBCB21
MNALEAILSRQSARAVTLKDPVPSGEDLAEILQAGMTAPDHGALRPWRFKIIEGDARARLGDVFAEALILREPNSDKAALDSIRTKPLRSPMIIAVCAEITENHPKVPPVEQVVAAACAAQNVITAAHAKGYGAIMLSGWPAYDDHVKNALGLSRKDAIVTFIYMGTPDGTSPVKERPGHEAFTAVWTG